MIAECPNPLEMKLWDVTIPILKKGKYIQKIIFSILHTKLDKDFATRTILIFSAVIFGFVGGLITFL